VCVCVCVFANKQVLVLVQQASFHLRQRRRGCSTSVIGGDSTSTWKVIQAFHHPLSLDYFIHFESVHLLDIPYFGAPNWLLFTVLLCVCVCVYLYIYIYIYQRMPKECIHILRDVMYVLLLEFELNYSSNV